MSYYGPILADTVSSTIKTAPYTEYSPGNLSPGTFQDLIPAAGVKRRQCKSVIDSGTVWFFYSEGDANQVIKCRTSLDNGVTYQPAFTIAGDGAVNAHWFDAEFRPFNPAGVTLTFLADSISPVGNSFDKMVLFEANTTAPNVFTAMPLVNNGYNDTSVTSPSANVHPILVHYLYGGTSENIGISWKGNSPQGSQFYFDALSFAVGINELNEPGYSVSAFPSPATDILNVQIKGLTTQSISLEIISADGRVMLSQSHGRDRSSSDQIIPVNISSIASGNYFIRVISGKKEQYHRFVVQR
jgi:hypothetical protein